MECSCFAQTVLCVKRGQFHTIRMFSFLSSQLSTLFSRYLFRFLPHNIATCSSYNLRNIVEYKDRCQVIISLFWTFSQLWYYLLTRGQELCQHGTRTHGQVTLPLLGKQVLDIKRDIRSTMIDTCVSDVVQHAFNQQGMSSQFLILESHSLPFCECLSTQILLPSQGSHTY